MISCDFHDGAPCTFQAYFEPEPRGFSWRISGTKEGVHERYVNGYLPIPQARGQYI